ncbi:ribosome maturation factor RimM [Intestinibacillus massiliensis]|uniref:ribosome maturation factor RimM n=1 Tax=Intestinibacillus massiliensis TaxID=1871029 RepID=UPI000B360097|nr:ribosome maturation factor RimM [Intestinibacillus massiliensis]
MQKEFLEAGQIVNTHGVTGDVKVQSWCDAPEVLTDFDTLYWADHTPVHIEKAYVHKGCVIMRLEGVTTMEQADALRQKVLYLRREDVELPEDLVFIQDILGFEVFDARTGRTVGTLREVITTNPAHDLYEIERADGGKCYVPAVKPFLERVDQEAGRITIRSIEGLLDEN